MNNILKITKLHFTALFRVQAISCSAVLLLHILISVAVLKLVGPARPAGVGDFIALCWIFIIGLVFFSASFKYTLSLGISRKRFFLAGNLSIALLAALFAVLVVIFYVINLWVSNVWMLYPMIYKNQDLFALIVWEFAALLLLGVLAWCIRLVYYVSNRNIKFIVSIAPFILAALLILFNALVHGGMGRTLLEFIKILMGLSGAVPNPHIGTISMLAAAIILSGPIFLLLRRAQIND